MEKYTADENRYERLSYRRCGNSGILLPALSLGLWHNFGEVDDPRVARSILLRAFDLGIHHIDLANNYGPPPGAAESFFGRVLREDLAPYRDELIISTKAGHLMWAGPCGDWGSRKHLTASLDQSLKRMRLEYVDIFYHHRSDPQTPLEETMGALAHAVTQGKALYVGLSKYPLDRAIQAMRLLRRMGTPCLIYQDRYSILQREIESEHLDFCDSEGTGVIAFSPLAQGLLTDKYLQNIPADSRAAKAHGFLKREEITEQLQEQLQNLNQLAQARGQSLAQMALAWALRNPQIASLIIGVGRVAQLEQNIEALKRSEFSAEELDRIDQILNRLKP